MDRSWAYRPPMHVGDRVIWTPYSDTLSTTYSYTEFLVRRNNPSKTTPTQINKQQQKKYRGTVWWIGRLIEVSSGWSAGVEFDESVPGGGDGTWFSRSLFTCPDGHGRFLPVSQLRKVPRLLVWPTPVTEERPVVPARTKNKYSRSQTESTGVYTFINTETTRNCVSSIKEREENNSSYPNTVQNNSDSFLENEQKLQVSRPTTNVPRIDNLSDVRKEAVEDLTFCSSKEIFLPSPGSSSNSLLDYLSQSHTKTTNQRSITPNEFLTRPNRNNQVRPHSATPSFSILRNEPVNKETIIEENFESVSQQSKCSSGFDEDSLSSRSTSDRFETYQATSIKSISSKSSGKESDVLRNYLKKNNNHCDSSITNSRNDTKPYLNFPSSTRENCPENFLQQSSVPQSISHGNQFVFSLFNSSTSNQSSQPAQNLNNSTIGQAGSQQNQILLPNLPQVYAPLPTYNIEGSYGAYTPVLFGVPQGATYAPVVFALPPNPGTYTPVVFGLPNSEGGGPVYAPTVLPIPTAHPEVDPRSISAPQGLIPSSTHFTVSQSQPTISCCTPTSLISTVSSTCQSTSFQQYLPTISNSFTSRSVDTSDTTSHTAVADIDTNLMQSETRFEEKSKNSPHQFSKSCISSSEASKIHLKPTRRKTTTFEAESSQLSKSSSVSISRLLKKLEAAIARGDHTEAAVLAKDLATLKVNCSVTQTRDEADKQSKPSSPTSEFTPSKTSSSISQNVPRQNYPESVQDESGNSITPTNTPSAVLTSKETRVLQATPFHGEVDQLKRPEQNGSVQEVAQCEIQSAKEPQINTPKVDTQEEVSTPVKRREKKSSAVNRREIKSDNVSRLIDAAAADPELPIIMENFNVQMYVEDRSSHQGPIDVNVNASMTVGELRSKVFEEYGFPPDFQRWILGRKLADDDNQTLAQHRVTTEGCPVFLYLVAPRPQIIKSPLKHPAVIERSNSAVINSVTTPKNQAAIVRQQSLGQMKQDSPRSELISPKLSSQQSGAVKQINVNTKDIKRHNYSSNLEIEDPIKGNELIRKEEERDMKDARLLSNMLQGKPLPQTSQSNSSGTASETRVLDKNRKTVPTVGSTSTSQPKANVLKTQTSMDDKKEINKTNQVAGQQEGKLSTSAGLGDIKQRIQADNEQRITLKQNQIKPELSPRVKRKQQQVHDTPQRPHRSPMSQRKALAQHAQSQQRPENSPKVQRKSSSGASVTQNASSDNKLSTTSRLGQTTMHDPMPRPTPLILPGKSSSITPSAPPLRDFVSTLPKDGWICPRCTLVNPQQRPGCEACSTEKPTETNSTSELGGVHVGDGMLASATDRGGVVSSNERFECKVCFMEVAPRAGVVLRDCLHMFCRECLAAAIKYSDTAEVKCPYRDQQYSCDAALQEREVKALVSEADYEKHLQKSVKEAAGSMQNVFHCKTPDCRGFCVFEDNVNVFLCTVCYKQNCLTCQAQHAGQSCKEYQEMVALQQDMNAIKTKKFFDDMIRRGDGMPCPHCSVMLVRKWGCDWMRCPMCRTEICWVTRGPRWGPKGQGDTSGGCQCGIKGRKCHPKCTYCH